MATKKKRPKRRDTDVEIQMKKHKGIAIGKRDTSFTRGGKEEGET